MVFRISPARFNFSTSSARIVSFVFGTIGSATRYLYEAFFSSILSFFRLRRFLSLYSVPIFPSAIRTARLSLSTRVFSLFDGVTGLIILAVLLVPISRIARLSFNIFDIFEICLFTRARVVGVFCDIASVACLSVPYFCDISFGVIVSYSFLPLLWACRLCLVGRIYCTCLNASTAASQSFLVRSRGFAPRPVNIFAIATRFWSLAVLNFFLSLLMFLSILIFWFALAVVRFVDSARIFDSIARMLFFVRVTLELAGIVFFNFPL